MDNEQARQLIKKYNSGQCTEAEKTLIEKSFFAFNEQPVEISHDKLQALKKTISKALPAFKLRSIKVLITISTAAAIIAFAFYIFIPREESEVNKSMHVAERVFPKGNAAHITLSNGKTLELDTSRGEINVNGSKLSYTDGSIAFINNDIKYQTISTPNGGEYKIVLSDGTKVWLNAATVLQYPTSFRERTERRVKLVSGEAYFEVAKDKNHPFIVVSRNQNLRVLGTHFNINTYDEHVKTTLLEGSVNLKSIMRADSVQLKPGEESVTNGVYFRKRPASIGINMAWKNGKIKFSNADLRSILGEAERWYDIRVEYDYNPNIHLTGGISRKSSLATLLKLLQMSGINFTLNEEHDLKVLRIKS